MLLCTTLNCCVIYSIIALFMHLCKAETSAWSWLWTGTILNTMVESQSPNQSPNSTSFLYTEWGRSRAVNTHVLLILQCFLKTSQCSNVKSFRSLWVKLNLWWNKLSLLENSKYTLVVVHEKHKSLSPDSKSKNKGHNRQKKITFAVTENLLFKVYRDLVCKILLHKVMPE